MIMLWPMHRPGQRQYVYLYVLNRPELRQGFYVEDYIRAMAVNDGSGEGDEAT